MKWIAFDDENIAKYSEFINSHEFTGIWHRPDWLMFQKAAGRICNGFFFGIEDDGVIVLGGLLLIQKSKFGNYGYIPAGIICSRIDKNIYDFFYENLKKTAEKYGAFFTQMDSTTPFSEEYEKITAGYENHIFYRKLPIPQYTGIIKLSQSLEEIMDNMKPKGRYNIRLAEKKGVIIKTGRIDDIPAFYGLLRETTVRDGFNPNHPESYYRLMLEHVKESVLLMAFHENDLLCADIFTFAGHQGLYYYGASSNIKRSFMAPYLVQWEAIKIAKDRGCKYFDFMGIADPDGPTDTNGRSVDRLAGVTEFKLKFGIETVKFRPPCFIVHNRLMFNIYELVKKFR